MSDNLKALGDVWLDFIRKHQLAAAEFTESQLAEAFRQALAAGDFQRHVCVYQHKQCVDYLPYREVSQLRNQYYELLQAVESKHEGETRHETALRYIVERERSRGATSGSPEACDR